MKRPLSRAIRAIPLAAALAAAAAALSSRSLAAQESSTPAAQTPSAQRADSCPPRLAVVLSGGGAKGFAHIGVLQALDSLRIRPDLIVGTSMGALVGALYASGMSGRQIEALVRESPLERLFRRDRTPAVPRLGGIIQPVETLDPVLIWERRARSLDLRSPAVRQDEVNALLTSSLLHGNLQAAGHFDRLPIPFLALATDLRNRRPVTLGNGDLAHAVRASIAIPGVFTPVVLDSIPLVDGGFAENVPMGPARALNARRLLVSDVIDRPEEYIQSGSAVAVIEQAFRLLLHEAGDTVRPGDIVIRPPTAGVGILDFTPAAAARLVAAGRAISLDSLALYRMQDEAPTCRSTPVGAAPDSALLRLLRDRIQGLAAFAPQALWLNPSRVGDSLVLSPVAELPPAGRIAVGLGYDNQRGGHAWAGSEDVGELRGRVRVGAMAYIGEQRRLGLLRLSGPGLHRTAVGADRRALPDPRTGRPPWSGLPGLAVRPGIVFHALDEDVLRYDADGRLSATVPFRDLFVYAGAELESVRGWYAALGPVAQWWTGRDSLWSSPAARRQALGGIARLAWTIGPTPISDEAASADGAVGEALWTNRYQRVLLRASAPVQVGTVAVQGRALLGWGAHLPVGETFVLGGGPGFPGTKYGERRGDRVATIAVTGTRWVQGPIYARAELAAGSTATGGPILPTRSWGVGASAGVVVSTPFGSIVVSGGLSSWGRSALLVQVGEP